ncbi:hypothetical protein Tco_0687442 [Tanacetum coccineum]
MFLKSISTSRISNESSRIFMLYMNCIVVSSRIRILKRQNKSLLCVDLGFPTAEIVHISTTNVIRENHIKAEKKKRFKLLLISKGSESYDFLPKPQRYVIDANPLGRYFNLSKKRRTTSQIYKYVCGLHASTLEDSAACIRTSCLSGKTTSNDKLRKSRIDILWGIWEKKSRRENMPYPRFTKVIIDYFLSKHKSLKKLKFQHFHTIKDDGVVSRLKIVRMGQIPPKKSRGKEIYQLTEAEKKLAARQVHATHARNVSEIYPFGTCKKKSSQNNCYFLKLPRRSRHSTLSPLNKSVDIIKLSMIAGDDWETAWFRCSEEGTVRIPGQHPILQQTTPIPTTTTTPPIITEALAIILEIPEITSFIALQLRVAKLEQDMSQVKKIDHSAAVLASIQSQVPPVVDKYLGTKLDDALIKTLERHTADLVEKYSMLPTLESSKKQESEKTALEEFDLKSALFKSMHKNKSANRNPANYRLYHALMEALIEDENAMDKEVADTVRDHKRKHDDDDDDDDDDEGPPAGSNQGKSTKRRRTRESESTKKPSTTKESSKDKDPKVGSKTGKSAPAKDPVEEPTDKVMVDEQYTEDIPISDEGHVSDPEDTDNAHMPKIPDTTTWFRPILEEERPASPEPEWVIPPIDLPEADNNWANAFAKAHQDPDENKLHNKIIDYKAHSSDGIVEGLEKKSSTKPILKIDLVNPEGHRIVPDISNPLPLGGPPGQVTIQPQFFFNKDLEYLLTGDKERNRALSISKLKAARYQDFGLEELVPSLWIESKLDHLPKQDKVNLHNVVSLWTRNIIIRKRVEDLQLGIESYQTKLNLEQPNSDASDFLFKEDYTIVNKPRAVIYRARDDNKKMMRINEVHKFSDETLMRIRDKLDFMVKDFRLFKFNKGMENRKWTEDDKIRSEDFIEDTLPILLSFTHCGNKSILRVLRIILVILPEHPSETKVFHNEDGNPARANIKQALGSAQDGDPLQDDVRLCLGDDLKKAQDHNQRQVKELIKRSLPPNVQEKQMSRAKD